RKTRAAAGRCGRGERAEGLAGRGHRRAWVSGAVGADVDGESAGAGGGLRDVGEVGRVRSKREEVRGKRSDGYADTASAPSRTCGRHPLRARLRAAVRRTEPQGARGRAEVPRG